MLFLLSTINNMYTGKNRFITQLFPSIHEKKANLLRIWHFNKILLNVCMYVFIISRKCVCTCQRACVHICVCTPQWDVVILQSFFFHYSFLSDFGHAHTYSPHFSSSGARNQTAKWNLVFYAQHLIPMLQKWLEFCL